MSAFQLRATALAAACLLLAIQTSAFNMENMCAQWSGEGYIGNPLDCTKWGYCKGQQLVSWGSCAPGQVYEPQSQTCQYNSTTPCSTSVVSSCTAMKSIAYVADPNDCTRYGYCYGNGTYGYGECPSGQRYAANNNTCVWGPSCPQDSICRFMADNIFVGDPNNCGQYLHCDNGYGLWGACTDGLFYNAALGVCEEENVCTGSDSGSGSGTGSGSSSLPPATNATVCTEAVTTDEFHSDSLTCYGYYRCENDTAVGQWAACPSGSEFDEANQQCVSPASLACTLDRCANTDLTFAAVAYTNCTEYTYCPSGAKAYCSSAAPYYDEVNKKCVPEIPEYPICTIQPPAE